MPSKKPSPIKSSSVQTSAQSPAPSISSQAVKSATEAVDMAHAGLGSIEQLRAIILAIYKLSNDNEVIRELAKVGIFLADDRHNVIDCERERLQEVLATLKGVSHG